MDNSVIEETNRPASAAADERQTPLRWLDLAFALAVPTYFGYLALSLTHSSWLHPVALELLPIAWIFARQRRVHDFDQVSKLAVAAATVLSTIGFASLSLPFARGVPIEQLRYDLSISLGTVWHSVPYASLLTGTFALALCHLGGIALSSVLPPSAKRQAHDAYFTVSAVVAHVAIVRYAGGPFQF
jgi:hypothetical protein